MWFFDLFKGKDKKKGVNSDKNTNLPALPHESKNIDKYENITQIDAIKGKDVITFQKISIKDIEKYNYQEIAPDKIKGGLSNIISGGTQIATISALNSNGLFSATVSPQLLTAFADGTFSTMIHQGGHIAAHAGFQSISATVFAPIAIMQLMSMVTGQYYMNGITKQLKSIDKKINQLIKFHHTEKIARLENAQEIIQQICNVQYPGIEHLTQLKTVEIEVGSIYREYSKYLEDSKSANLKIPETYKMSSQKHLDKLFLLDDESGFSFNFYMVTTSDELLHLIPVIEFMLNVKMSQMEINRSHQIEELYHKIVQLQEEDFFVYSSGKQMLNNYYAPFIKEAKEILNNTAFHEEECKARLGIMKKRKKDLESDVIDKAETLNIKTKLVEQMNKPIEIVYSINDDGKNLVYVKQ
ncbi:hypothetical protein FACS1894190_12170 [Spirochaetia bacterium]|nr:hypothetical protein FACS1894190_12170 [Spirochaetia bacterium]